MKPIDKGHDPGIPGRYANAKPELLHRIGLHCSYCEQSGSPQDLHVEHIYPKDPHPELVNDWDNFLVSCSSCNSYKHFHLGSSVQTNLETRYVWPHRDNTFLAFNYFDDGRIEVAPHLTARIKQAAESTLNMIGAMKSPAVATRYTEDIAYDGMQKRKETWEIAAISKADYLASDNKRPSFVARIASKIGHFSIWMTVFHDHPEIRNALISEFKAAAICFCPNASPVTRGRIQSP